MLTLKKFLSIINEGASIDKMVIDIQTAINNIDNQITQRTQPLITQKTQLQRRLSPLLKKKQQNDALAAKNSQQELNQQKQILKQGQQSVKTPGSTDAATPGVS